MSSASSIAMFNTTANSIGPLTLICSLHILCSPATAEGLPISGNKWRRMTTGYTGYKKNMSNNIHNRRMWSQHKDQTCCCFTFTKWKLGGCHNTKFVSRDINQWDYLHEVLKQYIGAHTHEGQNLCDVWSHACRYSMEILLYQMRG
jgi:hypothetical protein